MKSKSIFLMAVSLGFGLVAAIGITQVMGRSNQPTPAKEEPRLPVLVASQDININDELLPEMFTEEEWPARLVPEGVATSMEELEGMVTTARIGKKGTVYLSNVLEKSRLREKKIPVGYKVIGIKLGADDHLHGLLEAGDLVDIMVVSRAGNRSGTGSTAKTFLRKVKVWSIGSKTKKDIEQNASAKGSTVVGLLCTEKQAERIILAQRIAELKLAMRGKEDDSSKYSSGTNVAEITGDSVDGAEPSIASMLRQFSTNAPATTVEQTVGTQEPQKERFTMRIYTSDGPTQYHFDRETGMIPSRVQGFAGQAVPEAPQEESLPDLTDLDDDTVDADSDSLIEDLGSEPNS